MAETGATKAQSCQRIMEHREDDAAIAGHGEANAERLERVADVQLALLVSLEGAAGVDKAQSRVQDPGDVAPAVG